MPPMSWLIIIFLGQYNLKNKAMPIRKNIKPLIGELKFIAKMFRLTGLSEKNALIEKTITSKYPKNIRNASKENITITPHTIVFAVPVFR